MLRGEFSRSSPTNDRTLEMAWEQPLWAFDGVISHPTGEHGEKLNSANFVSHNFNHGIWIPKREAEVVPSMVPKSKCEIWDAGKTSYIPPNCPHREWIAQNWSAFLCFKYTTYSIYIYILIDCMYLIYIERERLHWIESVHRTSICTFSERLPCCHDAVLFRHRIFNDTSAVLQRPFIKYCWCSVRSDPGDGGNHSFQIQGRSYGIFGRRDYDSTQCRRWYLYMLRLAIGNVVPLLIVYRIFFVVDLCWWTRSFLCNLL